MTLDEAKKLKVGQIIYHVSNKNADGSKQRWRVNGKVKLWKCDSSRIKVPIKHGLWNYDYLTEDILHHVSIKGD